MKRNLARRSPMALLICFNFILCVLILLGCPIGTEYIIDYGDSTTFNCIGDPVFFIMGQSNADDKFAEVIFEITNMPTCQINHTGQPIKNWLYNNDYLLNIDIKFLSNRHPEYFIWFQGESDYLNTERYDECLKHIINIGIDNKTEIIIIGIWRDDKNVNLIRSIQKGICDREGYIFIDSKYCDRIDGIHLSEKGKKQLAHLIYLSSALSSGT